MKGNIITVEGRGRLRVEPDTAVIKCVVASASRSYLKANREMNRRVGLLRRAIQGLGVEDAELKTMDFAMTRETRRNPKTERYELAGYEACHSLELRLPLDKERLNQAVEVLLGSKADAQVDVSFTVADPEPVRARLLVAAVENARQRAEVMARAADTKLGRILNINYGDKEGGFRSEATFCSLEASGPGTRDIEAGNYRVEDTVTVTWEISDQRRAKKPD